ncbi:hypothetical protein KEJ26_05365 [Candidatus Bathyarchaeota archaeon]|nr:hypothetical protein [Candidatus Bathyarchaeota archaeon]
MITILFDGGASMNVRTVITQSPRALLLASLGFFLSVCVIFLVATYALALNILLSIFLGCVLGGSRLGYFGH